MILTTLVRGQTSAEAAHNPLSILVIIYELDAKFLQLSLPYTGNNYDKNS